VKGGQTDGETDRMLYQYRAVHSCAMLRAICQRFTFVY